MVDVAESYHQAVAEIERLTHEPVELTGRQGATP